MSRLNKKIYKAKKKKKRHMYMFTLSQKTLETQLLEITKSIPHTPPHTFPRVLQVLRRKRSTRVCPHESLA